jgi:hypothetical protein
MRSSALALFVLLWSSGTTPAAADPPIVFQVQSVDRFFEDFRAAASMVGGDNGIKAVNDGIRETFGEKGLEGLDLGRPVFGYVLLAPKPEDITAVVAFPITSEKEFLDLCERTNRRKPTLVGKTKDLYELPPLDTGYKAFLRFSDQYAYIAYGYRPMAAIEAKALVPLAQVYVPTETALISGRLYFDRVPLAVKLALPTLAEEVKKTILGGLYLSRQEQPIVKAVMPEVEKLLARYAKLAAGADVLTARISLDVPAGKFVAEATLAGKPGSELAAIIAARKPTMNKFGSLITAPDTVSGFALRLPLFEEEIRAAVNAGLDEGARQANQNAPPLGKPILDALFKGLTRTVKTGEFDIAGAIRGPDANGWYTAVGAVAFEDPADLEKALRKFVEAEAPPDFQAKVKWEAAKVGEVAIHTWKPGAGGFLDITKVFGGEDCTVAVACAPHGIYVAIGPDAVKTLEGALSVKPVAAPVLDVVVNPARMVKFIHKRNGPNDPQNLILENALGADDKLRSVFSVTLEGGKELKAACTMDMRVIPRAMFYERIQRQTSEPMSPPLPPVGK